jgi:hypothetical protein
MTRLSLGLALSLFLLLGTTVQAEQPGDFDTESGHFYTQTNGQPSGQSGEGYHISDEDGVPLWRTFRSLGGTQVLGYPISRRYQSDGFTCQATQRGLLQYSPTTKQVQLINVLDIISASGRDAELRQGRLVPYPLDSAQESGLSAAQVTTRRLGLLDANQAIRTAYHSAPEPMVIYGLPTSEVIDTGPANVIRLQRGVIYEWKTSVPWARPGEVSVGNAGDMLKEMGLLPASAVVPEPSPAPLRNSGASRGGGRDLPTTEGVATWYGSGFHGRLMSNREPFNMYDPAIAASNAYPLGSFLKITHLRTGGSIVVRVTDRGGFSYPIVVDLSYAAFSRLADPGRGVIPIRVEPVD